jgi:hypothetical protein
MSRCNTLRRWSLIAIADIGDSASFDPLAAAAPSGF